MAHTNTLLPVPRFAVVGCTIIHCGRDVDTFCDPHDAHIIADMLNVILSDISDVALYDALFPRIGD